MSYKDFPIRGVDVSSHQETVDFAKMRDAGLVFAGIRTSVGIVTDAQFARNWVSARGRVERLPYHLLDFYSHRMGWTSRKYTDTEWGKAQAQFVWNLHKNDVGELPLFVDVEPCGLAGVPKLNFINAPWIMTILRAFLTEYDRLSGGKAGIYTSPGYLALYGDWFKDRTLWLAWYYRYKTMADIQARLAAVKWRGKAVIWQYTSDGDINDDTLADGLQFTTGTRELDLNVYLGPAENYSEWSGTDTPVIVEVETPTIEDEVISEPSSTMTVSCLSGLNMRDVPIGIEGSQVVGWKANGTVVNVLEKRTVGSDVWARVDVFKWCAIRYGGNTYLT